MKHSDKYDLIFGIGYSCSCSTILRAVGLQFLSFPFDWIGLVPLKTNVGLVESGFDGWMREENMRKLPEDIKRGHDRYVDSFTGLHYWHDFDVGCSLHDMLPVVREKYHRRISRLEKLIGQSKRILIVWVGDGRQQKPVGKEEIDYCLRVFSEKWPTKRFNVLVFEIAKGVPAAEMRIEHGDCYERYSFDYRNHDPQAEAWTVDIMKIGCVLSRYSVRDYRTREEKQQYRMRCRKRDFARYNADSWPLYIFRKLKYKLQMHFAKNANKRGCR